MQAVTLDQMTAQMTERWRRAVGSLIEAAVPEDPEDPANWASFASLLPHTQAALAPESAGLARIASYVGQSGSYLAARDLARPVLAARESNDGPDHPGTLEARKNVAYWTGQAGNAAAACELFA